MQQAAATEIRIDWFQVINDLGRRGFPSQLIADSIGVAKSTLLGWKQGAEPKHGDGIRTGKLPAAVPKRREALPAPGQCSVPPEVAKQRLANIRDMLARKMTMQ